MRVSWIPWGVACLAALGCGGPSSPDTSRSGLDASVDDAADTLDGTAIGPDATTGDDATAGADAPGMSPDAATDGSLAPQHAWDWTGIIGTGQSLSVGAEAPTASLTKQPFHNLKLSLGAASVTVPPYNPDDPALSVVLMVGAGLLIRTLWGLLHENPGFNPSQVVVATLRLSTNPESCRLWRNAAMRSPPICAGSSACIRSDEHYYFASFA